MQGLLTHTAMMHADLPLTTVRDHFLNMGGIIGYLELDAYLHGMMTLPHDDCDVVAQAVNELLDDIARTGGDPCCRAPYSSAACFGPASTPAHACRAAGRGRVTAPAGMEGLIGTAGRRVPGPSPLQPVRRSARRER